MRVNLKVCVVSMMAGMALNGCANMQQSIHNLAQSANMSAAQRYGATVNQGSQQVVVSQSAFGAWPVVDRTSDTVMQVPPGQTYSDWQESYTVMYDTSSQSVADGVNNKVSAIQQSCPGSTARTLSQNANSASLVLTVSPSCSDGNLIVIVKVMQGSDGVYFAQYSAKQASVSQSEIARMRSVVLSARLR